MIIFDLRDECHGLINGMPVHWKDECLCCEHKHLKEALEYGHASIEEINQINRLDLAISQAITEGEFVESYGHFYVRAPMADGDLPHDLFVDQFVQFIQDVSPNHWIHFHCRTGGEKASTFAVLSDIIKNGRQMNLEDILAKHELMNEADLAKFNTEEERLDHIQQTLDFISDFYAYCHEVPDFSTSWSEWVSQSPFITKQNYFQLNARLVDRRHEGEGRGKGGYAFEAEICVQFNPNGKCEIYMNAIGEYFDKFGNQYVLEVDINGKTSFKLRTRHGKNY